jgi:hypothetical protein
MMEKIRLLSAFQALEMMGKHGFKKAYGVNKTTARKIIFDITGIKIKRGQTPKGSSLEEYFDSIGYTWREEG